jgi:hypothetical protein
MCPEKLETAFEAWEFSEEELPLACVFTELQRQWIRTQLSKVATEMINFTLDPTNLVNSALQRAELEGQKNAYEYLIAESENHQSALLERLQDQQDKQATE